MKYKLIFLTMFCFANIFAQNQTQQSIKYDCVIDLSLSDGVIMFQNVNGTIEFSKDTIYVNFYEAKSQKKADFKIHNLTGKWYVYPESEMKLLLNKKLELVTKDGKIFRLQTPKYAEILKRFEEWKKKYDIQGKK